MDLFTRRATLIGLPEQLRMQLLFGLHEAVRTERRTEITDLQNAFRERNALQCGYCTPAMLMAAQDLLRQQPDPSRQQIRNHLSGNYCRCTGYQAIVDAVEATAQARKAQVR